MSPRRWTLTVVMFVFFSQCSLAQSNDWAIVKQILPGQEVKVQLIGGKSFRGSVKSVNDDSIQVGKHHLVLREDVHRVSLPKPNHRARNTLLGLAGGAGTGLVIGAVGDAQNKSSWFPNIGKEVLPPFFGVIGMGVGVLLPTGGWHEVYVSK
jgi:hypothetical protein